MTELDRETMASALRCLLADSGNGGGVSAWRITAACRAALSGDLGFIKAYIHVVAAETLLLEKERTCGASGDEYQSLLRVLKEARRELMARGY